MDAIKRRPVCLSMNLRNFFWFDKKILFSACTTGITTETIVRSGRRTGGQEGALRGR
jgi:hypothetical protein